MKLLIKSAKIIDPNSPHKNSIQDIFVNNGQIEKIAKKVNPPGNYKTIDAKNKCVSPGWFDMYANLCEPGFEYKEDLASGCNSAMFGGITGIACSPCTDPVIHSKSEVEYVINKTKHSLVDVYPIGAVTQGRKGEELTEMYDMHKSGAVAFSDGDSNVSNSGVALRALQYVKGFDGLVMSYPNSKDISNEGVMNEGDISTRLGLKGIPSISEEYIVQRDILIAEYTGSRVHFTNISTSDSVDLIRKAKRKKIKVSASIASYQIVLDHNNLLGYDANYKVLPPLRSQKDIAALKRGLKDGTIDSINSNHTPQDEDSKNVEFDTASYGIINLETVFAIANTYLKNVIKLEDIITKMAITPRQLLNLQIPVIKEKERANMTIFDPDIEWELSEDDIQSKSKNTPFLGSKLTGKAIGVINNDQIHWN